MTTFQDLFEQYAAIALEKQWVLQELLEEADWQVDLQAGILTINDADTFPVQLIGSDADADQSWLWAWANPHLDLPASVLQAAATIRTFGEKEQIAEFTQPQLSLQSVTGHQLAMVAANICNVDGYFVSPYDGGSIFLLLTAPMVQAKMKAKPTRMVNVFNELIDTFPINHRRGFIAYLNAKGFEANINQTKDETYIVARNKQNKYIRAGFDAWDRLVELTTTVAPDEKFVS